MTRDDLARLLWDAVWGCVWQVSDHLAWEKLPERFKERWRPWRIECHRQEESMSDQLRPCPSDHDAAQLLVRDGVDPGGKQTQIYHVACPKCGWRTEDCYREEGYQEAMELWNRRPVEEALRARAEDAESKLADTHHQAAAMREALTAMLDFSVDGVPHYYPTHILTAAYSALQPDAGREYVPKDALDAEREKVAKLRELLAKYAVRYEHEYPPICTACYHVGPGHYRDCEINRVLAETEVKP